MDDLAVLAEPRRRAILRLVWDRELPAGEIAEAVPVTFGAVSQHLAVLSRAGFVDLRRDGRRRYYRANQARLGPLAEVLRAMWDRELDGLEAAIREDEDG